MVRRANMGPFHSSEPIHGKAPPPFVTVPPLWGMEPPTAASHHPRASFGSPCASMPSLRALAKQSILARIRKLDCFVVSLLSMTTKNTSPYPRHDLADRKSTRLNSSHANISYA